MEAIEYRRNNQILEELPYGIEPMYPPKTTLKRIDHHSEKFMNREIG